MNDEQRSLRVVDGGACSVTVPWKVLAQFLAAAINSEVAAEIGTELAVRTVINRVEHVETNITPMLRTLSGPPSLPNQTDDGFVLRSAYRIISSDVRCAEDAVLRVRADVKLGLAPGLNPFGERVRGIFEAVECRQVNGLAGCQAELECDIVEGQTTMLGPDGETYPFPIVRENVLVRPLEVRGTPRDSCNVVASNLIHDVGCTQRTDGRWDCLTLAQMPNGRFRYNSQTLDAIPTVADTNDVVFTEFDVDVNPDPDNAACNIVEAIADRFLDKRIGRRLGGAQNELRAFLRTQIFEQRAPALGVPLAELRTCSVPDDPACYSGEYVTPSGFHLGRRDRCHTGHNRCSILRIEPRRLNVAPEGLEVVLAESARDPQQQLVAPVTFGAGAVTIGGFCNAVRYPAATPDSTASLNELEPASSAEIPGFFELGEWRDVARGLRSGLHVGGGPREICDPRDPEHCDDICQQEGLTCAVTSAGGGGGPSCTAGRCCTTDQTGCGAVCANLDMNASHCGACFNACETRQSCQDGTCVCASPNIECGHPDLPDVVCVDPLSDPLNCGACGNACSDAAHCSSGLCCAALQANCEGDGCIDLLSNPLHCGACGNSCGNSEPCVSGICVPL